MSYLVKFVSEKKYKPNILNCSAFGLKLGTFHHYRNIEDEKFRDTREGQRGREIVIERPCDKLRQLSDEPGSGILLDPENIDKSGKFVARTALLVHDHLAEFNCWVFCCSLIDTLEEIPNIQRRFGAEDYFFITDPERFSSRLLRSLGQDLKDNMFNEDKEPRIASYHFQSSLLLDGYHSTISYDTESQWMKTAHAETLTAFMAEQAKEVDRSIWFRKHEKFREEKEFRWVFYPSLGRAAAKEQYYSVNDDYRILSADLCGCTSGTPTEAVFAPKRPRLDPLIQDMS